MHSSNSPPPARPERRFDATRVTGCVLVHLLACLAPFAFTSAGLAVAVVLTLLTGQVGVSFGYHRLLAHRGFRTPAIFRIVVAFLGTLALQGGPLRWCCTHRGHHCHADQDADPQQSGAGFLRAHLLWALTPLPPLNQQLIRDLSREAPLRFLEWAHGPLNLALALLLFGIGWAIADPFTGLSLLAWGCGVRVVYLWHSTFLVNSVCHRWGYRNFDTADASRNCWWVALLSFGEGWHNNHHAHPRRARHGLRWFELDPTNLLIDGLAWVGLVSEVAGEPKLR